MSITSSSVIVELNISFWAARKLDREITNTIIHDNDAVTNAAKVHKDLMAGTTLHKEILNYAQSCRDWHRGRTLPWADGGSRLLPTSLFMDYKAEMNQRRDKFNDLVAQFIDEYPSLVTAAENNMRGLFKVDDYPTAAEIESKFDFRLAFSPVPDSGDFRLDIPQQDLLEMGRNYQDVFDERLADAMRGPWEQLHKMLVVMSEKLTERENGEKKRWHDTFVTNAHEMCAMLTHLNLTGDPKLEEARRQLEIAMSDIDIDDIKESPLIRDDVKTKVDAILKKYEW